MNQQNNMGAWGCALTAGFLFHFIFNFEIFILTNFCLDIFQCFCDCLMLAITNEETGSAKTMLQKSVKLWH